MLILPRRYSDDDDPKAWEAVTGAAAFDPRSVSAVGAWLRVPYATVTESGVSSLPDALSSNPAVQATDAARPPREATANGLQVMRCVDDRLSWPGNAGNNQLVTWGIGFHLKLSSIPASFYFFRYGANGTTFDPTATDSHYLVGLTNGQLRFNVMTDATGAAIRRADTSTGAVAAGVTVFVTCEFNGLLAAEADRFVITLDAAAQSLSFVDAFGSPGAMPAALQGQPGGSNISLFSRRESSTSLPVIGDVGPNIYVFGSAMPGVTAGLLTPAARAALSNFERPV